MSLRNLFQTISYKIECKKELRIKNQWLVKKKKDILEYYSRNSSNDPEINEAIRYLKSNPIQTFCSDFTKAYRWDQVEVFNDKAKNLPYVLHEGKRLYFVRSYRKRTIQYCYSGLLAEQNPSSPHCYLGKGFTIEENDTLLDVGSAEGILSLQHIEKLNQVVLFERDPQWVEALAATFEPWKEKVTIVRKYVSNSNDEENITLDSYLTDKPYTPTIVKIDVEGAEYRVLEGMVETMKISKLKIAICTYHQAQDFSVLSEKLNQKGFSQQTSNGYMLFLNQLDELKPPYFRRGLIRATSNN